MKYLIFTVIHTVLLITTSWAQNSILVPIDTLEIILDTDALYSRSDANAEYFIFQNLSTQNIHIYSFESKKQNIIQLKRGRGPNEYLQIGNIVIDDKNTIYMLDANGYKLLSLDVFGNYYEDITHEIKSLAANIFKDEKNLYISTVFDSFLGSYYHKLIINGNSMSTNSLHSYKSKHNEFSIENPFNFYGRVDINKHNLIHAHIYYSKFTIYPLDTTKSKIELNYDEYIVDKEPLISNGDRVAALPPAKVLVKLKEVFIHPTNSYNVYINAEGQTKNKSYFKNMIYKYDLNKEEFSDSYDLGFTPSELMRYKNKLYVIPKFEDGIKHKGIYVYEIVD